jgi:hypothetical protein
MDHHYLKQLVFILLAAWFALFAVNPVLWAYVTLATFILSVGFFVSWFVLGVRGWTNLTLSSAGCGSGIALIF